MADNGRGWAPGGDLPRPPPPEAPTTDPGGGSTRLGVVLGLVGAVLASFSPLLFSLLGWLLLPAVLVLAIVLAVRRSTRRTGVGMLVGFAVGFIATAGTCIYLLSNTNFG
jgi:tetrahydromethanopterin S-methyltransferase subunit C